MGRRGITTDPGRWSPCFYEHRWLPKVAIFPHLWQAGRAGPDHPGTVRLRFRQMGCVRQHGFQGVIRESATGETGYGGFFAKKPDDSGGLTLRQPRFRYSVPAEAQGGRYRGWRPAALAAAPGLALPFSRC